MVRKSLLLTLLGLLAAAQVQAQSNERWLCTFDNNERQIELSYLRSGQSIPCEVRYQRDNESWQTLWSADNVIGYCEEKTEEFVSQQRAWGWRCDLESPQSSEPATEEPAERESAIEPIEPIPDEQVSTVDPAVQSMTELARTTDFFQAYSVLTPLRLAVIDYHSTQGRYPNHLSQLAIRAEQLRDHPTLRDVRLTDEGVIFALATAQLGDDATLRLQPTSSQGTQSYEWRCTTNVVVRHNPQCQLDNQLRFPNR